MSCNKSSSSHKDIIANKDSCIIIGLLPTLDCVPFYYAREKGIYESLGIQVKFVFAKSQMDMDSYLEKGYVDIATSDLFRTILQQNKKKKVKFLTCSSRTWEILGNKKLRINKYQHLNDHMVGMTRNSVLDFLCDSINRISQKGILLKPQINDVFLRLHMLNEGQLDAALLPIPITEKAFAQKHTRILPLISQEGLSGFSINSKSMEMHKNKIVLLLEAYNRAVDSLKIANNQSLTPVLLSRFGIDSIPSSIIMSRFLCHLSSPQKKNISTAIRWAKKRKIAGKEYTGDTLVYKFK